MLVDDDLRGVAAVGRRYSIGLEASIGELHLGAIVLATFVAMPAAPAGTVQDTDPDAVTHAVGGHFFSHLEHAPRELVPGHDGKCLLLVNSTRVQVEIVVHHMDIGMADPAVVDIDQHVPGAAFPAFEPPRL